MIRLSGCQQSEIEIFKPMNDSWAKNWTQKSSRYYLGCSIEYTKLSSILTITGSLLLIILLHASKEILIGKPINTSQRRLMLYNLAVPPGIFMISKGHNS